MCRADRRKCFIANLPARRGVLRCGSSDHDFGLGFRRHLTNPLGPCREFISHITPWQPTAVSTRRLATKAKGRVLLRDLALSIPIFRDLVRVPDHNACSPRNHAVPTNSASAFTSLSHDHTRCKSLLTAVLLQLPGSSLVADSRRRLLVRSLLWKITLPLKEILLSSNGNTRGSKTFSLWK